MFDRFTLNKTRRLASLQGEDRGVVALILFSLKIVALRRTSPAL